MTAEKKFSSLQLSRMPAPYFMTTVPNVTIWQSRYSKLNFSQVIINYERDTARLMLSDFKDQSLFTQQIGSSSRCQSPFCSGPRAAFTFLSLVNIANSDLWLADWGPPLWFWNSNIFWKLKKTPDIIDDYFNAIPWSFDIFLSPLPWTSKKLADLQFCKILRWTAVIWMIWLGVLTGRWVLIPAHISAARDYNEN